jgi:hypothetical protein
VASEDLTIRSKPIEIRRAVVSPAWGSEKVLTSDLWTYVDLWIRRNAKKTDALFYWNQAKEFYRASLGLPITASPLTLYYCFLNATKALLVAKKVHFQDQHGLTGGSDPGKTSLSKEKITLKGGGVLPSLINYYGESAPLETYSLKDMFYNMAFVHRAYCLSYEEKYLFFSLSASRYVKGVATTEGWLTANIEERFDDNRVLATLPQGFERDVGVADNVAIRKKARFRWYGDKARRGTNVDRLTTYHRQIRRNVTYIAGVGRWYLKRNLANASIIDRHAPTLIFASMHRLSELSRYDPSKLSRLLDTQRNWLLAEFIKTAPLQFLDEIACEMTGQEVHVPGIYAGSLPAPGS